MSVALLVLYLAVIIGFLVDARIGGALGIVALVLDLANVGGHVG